MRYEMISFVASAHTRNRDRRLSSTILNQLGGQIDRRDHAVGLGDSFAGNLECGAVIRTGPGKWQPQRGVHAAVKSVQLERDQSLIVIHAKHGVEFTFYRAMEYRVR